jgi:hypothetical protein
MRARVLRVAKVHIRPSILINRGLKKVIGGDEIHSRAPCLQFRFDQGLPGGDPIFITIVN